MTHNNPTANHVEWHPMPAGTLIRFAFQRKLRQWAILSAQIGIIVLAVIVIVGIRMSTMPHGSFIPRDTAYGGITCTQARQLSASMAQQSEAVQNRIQNHLQNCPNCRAAAQACH